MSQETRATPPTAADVQQAARRTHDHIRRTPALRVEPALTGLPTPVWLKLESAQATGSFKVRNAFALLLGAEVPQGGVVAASGGNFGFALAYAARQLGYPLTIFVPETTPEVKLAHIRAQHASVEVVPGPPSPALYEASGRSAAESGALLAHPFDQPEVMAGAGTCALELERQCPELDTVLVPVGGAGLIGGIATWLGGRVRVVAVETHGTASLHAARGAGERVAIDPSGVAMSSLGAPVVGELGWAVAQRWVDEAVVVEDAAVTAAQRRLWEAARVVAEPGGAVGFAALLADAYRPGTHEQVGVIVSGGNTDPATLAEA